MNKRIFLGDTETTGIDPSSRICEIAWHQIDEMFGSLNSGASLINPGVPISHGASAVNGITDDMVANAPSIEQYMELADYPLCGEDVVLVAHNVQFDYQFLKPFMSEGAELIDTLRCARILYPDADNHKQSTLAYYLGLQMERSKAHSADGDLDVLLQLLMRICRDAGCGILGLLEFQKQRIDIKTMPFGKHKGVALAELDTGYIRWLLKLDNLDPDLRAALVAL